MRKELCTSCVSSQRCFYEGTSIKELNQAAEFGRGELCPQLYNLIEEAANVKTPQTEQQITNHELPPVEDESQPENLNGQHEIKETPEKDIVPEVVEFIIYPEPEADISEIELVDIQDAVDEYLSENKPEPIQFTLVEPTHKPLTKLNGNGNGHKKPKMKIESQEQRMEKVASQVAIPLREYVDIGEYVEKTKIPEYMWAAFGHIAHVVDQTKKYTVDLDKKDKAILSRKVQNIIRANGIFEVKSEATRFLLSLQLLLKAWTLNTKGKSRDEIAPFL